jgi:hypothetical protein
MSGGSTSAAKGFSCRLAAWSFTHHRRRFLHDARNILSPMARSSAQRPRVLAFSPKPRAAGETHLLAGRRLDWHRAQAAVMRKPVLLSLNFCKGSPAARQRLLPWLRFDDVGQDFPAYISRQQGAPDDC